MSLLLVAVSSVAQITQNSLLLDTTYNGNRFVYLWDNSEFKAEVQDSLVITDSATTWNHDYISTKSSSLIIHVKKLRILPGNDTLVRYEKVRVPYYEIKKLIGDIYSSNALKRHVKKGLNDSYKKKISNEL